MSSKRLLHFRHLVSQRFRRKRAAVTVASFFSSSSDPSTFMENRWSKYYSYGKDNLAWTARYIRIVYVVSEVGCVSLEQVGKIFGYVRIFEHISEHIFYYFPPIFHMGKENI